MDGLSSASGVFAAVSIAFELAETIRKIVEFGKAVKDAPIHIRALFDDLEVLAAVISQIQQLNGYVACDNVTDKALRSCQIKILKLHKIISQAQLNLKSKSRVRRKWGAFKFVLDESEIKSIRTSIEEAKLTLQLILSTSLSKLVLSTACKQDQAVAAINTLTSLISQSTGQELGSSNPKMQIDYHGVCHAQYELTEDILVTENSTDIAVEKMPSTNACKDSLVRRKPTPFYPASRPFGFRFSDCQSSRQFNLYTPMITVSTESRTSIVKTIRSSEVTETIEEKLTVILYPNLASRLFGITRGMLISAKATSGWQYSIQPFRAVEENALIFEFCREGNLDGVRSLFKRNEASPWDRGPKGETPLLLASRYFQLDVASFLLQEGADPHACCWNGYEPINAIIRNKNKTVEIDPWLGILRLLQKYRREDYDDLTVGNMMWHVMLFYRPQKDISLSWVQRRAAIMKLFSMLLPFFANDNPWRSDLIYITVYLSYEQEVLQYILRTTKGYIDHIDLKPRHPSILHEAIHRRLLVRDLGSMRLIVNKTENLHRCSARSYRDPRPETPTMLAMYDRMTFLAWRNMLHDLGHETMAFVEQELNEVSVRDCGWTTSSLCELFDTKALPGPYYGPTYFNFPNCERCGQYGQTQFSGKLEVDLVWRRYLRDVRMKHLRTAPTNSTENSTPIGSPASENIQLAQETNSSSGNDENSTSRRELPYRIVCSTECKDGLCVAWVYDNNTDAEPDLPPYPCGSLSNVGNKKESETLVVVEKEPCPTDSMPGAFKDP
ncbi:hypothetical protein N431DRAFT_18376 [Stipitochalara longipes BDJ]|nr:hypothetical protein N431DRAFT_18376 [Stipitochalara longipes BDJ]